MKIRKILNDRSYLYEQGKIGGVSSVHCTFLVLLGECIQSPQGLTRVPLFLCDIWYFKCFKLGSFSFIGGQIIRWMMSHLSLLLCPIVPLVTDTAGMLLEPKKKGKGGCLLSVMFSSDTRTGILLSWRIEVFYLVYMIGWKTIII